MIRKYEETDIEELLEVWYEASSMAHPFGDSEFMEKKKESIEVYIPNTKTWVFTNKDALEGFIAMWEMTWEQFSSDLKNMGRVLVKI